ncbi:hypothetical protein PENTCL1PPCAC_24316, partial [Pristionchus entomophagus]
PVAPKKKQLSRFIDQLVMENEESTSHNHRYSRACGVCLTEVPRLHGAPSSPHAVTRSVAPARK